MEITKRYWDIAIVHFYDKSITGEASNISLKIPETIRNIDDYISNKKHIFIIERERTYYPIYTINKDKYFKTGSVNKKLYESDSQVVRVINNVAQYYINKSSFKNSIDLQLIKKFVRNSKYNIVSLLINDSNKCYGVTVKHITNKKVVPFYECTSKTDPKLCHNNYKYIEICNYYNLQ